MIFTKITIDNLYSFENFEIDLTYPRKSSAPLLEGEYLSFAPSFKFKKVCILLGTNASGKTSFGKILWGIQSFLHAGNFLTIHYLAAAIRNKHNPASITAEFVMPESKRLNRLKLVFNAHGEIKDLQLSCAEIRGSDTNITASKRLESPTATHVTMDDTEGLHNFRLHYDLDLSYYYVFTENDPSSQVLTNDLSMDDLPMVLSILKTFDPSITDVKPLLTPTESETIFEGYTVFFANGDSVKVTDKGASFTPKDRNRFSKGTYDILGVVGFISAILKSSMSNKGCTYFLDEKLSSSHSELERFILNLMIRKLQKDSQLFYTTHNHDVLDIQLPTHSFAFLHKDNEYTVIEQPEKLNFTKNDRNLHGYVRCNYFNTMPSTHLLDALWGND